MFGGDSQVLHGLHWGQCLILWDLSQLCECARAWGDNEPIESCFPASPSVIFHHIWHTLTPSRSKLPQKCTQLGNARVYSRHKPKMFKREKHFLDDATGLRLKGKQNKKGEPGGGEVDVRWEVRGQKKQVENLRHQYNQYTCTHPETVSEHKRYFPSHNVSAVLVVSMLTLLCNFMTWTAAIVQQVWMGSIQWRYICLYMYICIKFLYNYFILFSLFLIFLFTPLHCICCLNYANFPCVG